MVKAIWNNNVVDAARYYPHPNDAAANIRGRIAFWRDVQVSTA